ncbi:MAG: hypothetical protein V4692_00840, partial [Bdellovibrionota bacterium]
MKAVNALVIALLVVQAPLAFASTAGNIGLNHKAGEAKLTQDQIEAKARAATKGSTGRAEAPVAVTTKRVAAPKAAAPKAAAAKPAPAPAAAPALAGNEAAVKSDII